MGPGGHVPHSDVRRPRRACGPHETVVRETERVTAPAEALRGASVRRSRLRRCRLQAVKDVARKSAGCQDTDNNGFFDRIIAVDVLGSKTRRL